MVEHIKEFISNTHGCTIDFVSTELADRKKLRADLERLKDGDVDVFLTEIKAAAIDVVAEEADRRGVEVVFCDNVPVEIDGQEACAAARQPGRAGDRGFQGEKWLIPGTS